MYYSSCNLTIHKNNKIIAISFLAGIMLLSVYAPVNVSAEFVVNNLGIGGISQIFGDDDLVVFLVNEKSQGNDLNNDGEDNDTCYDKYGNIEFVECEVKSEL